MRKSFSPICLILAVLVLFAGCVSGEESEAKQPALCGAEQPAAVSDQKALQMLGGFADDRGYYLTNYEDGEHPSGTIWYVDFELAQMYPLDAFLMPDGTGDGGTSRQLYPYADYLFEVIPERCGETPPCIIVRDRSGKNPRMLISYADAAEMMSDNRYNDRFVSLSSLYFDGKYLYYLEKTRIKADETPADQVTGTTVLQHQDVLRWNALDVQTGQLVDSLELQDADIGRPVGVADGEPLFLKEIYPQKNGEYSTYELRLLDSGSGLTSTIYTLAGENYYRSTAQNPQDGIFYYVNEDRTFVRVDLNTGQESVTGALPSEWEAVTGFEAVGGRYALSVQCGGQTLHFWTDKPGESMSAYDPICYGTQIGMIPIPVLGIHGSEYFGPIQSKTEQITVSDQNGAPVSVERDLLVYGMIDQQAFWCGRLEYREITALA